MFLLFFIILLIILEPEIYNTLIILVSDYFYTFRFCWFYTLISLTKMIDNYFIFLIKMIKYLTSYPNNLIFCITSIILLYIIYKIIQVIFKK